MPDEIGWKSSAESRNIWLEEIKGAKFGDNTKSIHWKILNH
jgi:hypothetical protein